MKIRMSLILFVLTLALASPLCAETLRVISRENAIREQCKFFAPVKAKVKYNDELEVLSREGDWYKVKYRGTSGCIHKSAVEEASVSLSGVTGSKSNTASRDEVALAGKGFNPQVEDSFRKKNPNLDFHAVDRIEKYRIPDDTLTQFIRNGGLNPP